MTRPVTSLGEFVNQALLIVQGDLERSPHRWFECGVTHPATEEPARTHSGMAAFRQHNL